MKTLKEVRNFLNSIPDINEGGCGVAAYAMYLWLKKHNKLKSDFKFIFVHSNEYEFNQNNDALLEISSLNTPEAPFHILIEHRRLLLDSEPGIQFDYIGKKYNLIIKDITFIKRCLNNIKTWNCRFNRKKYVPIIESKLGIKLNIKLK